MAYGVVGSAGAPAAFLRTGVGARALALSGAFSAYTDDLTATYWNPGAAAYINRPGFASMYSWLSDDRNYNFINFVMPSDYGVFGINFLNFSIGGIEARKTDTLDYNPVSYFDNGYFLTYGKEFIRSLSGESLAAGGNIKIIQSGSIDYSAMGFSADLGLIVKPHKLVSVGVVFRDFYGRIKSSTGTEEKIPFVMNLAVLVNLMDNALKLSAEAQKNEFEGGMLMAGVEGCFFKMLFLRGGVTYGLQSFEFNQSLGVGVRYPFGGLLGQVDYAFLRENYYNLSEPQHRLSVSAFF